MNLEKADGTAKYANHANHANHAKAEWTPGG